MWVSLKIMYKLFSVRSKHIFRAIIINIYISRKQLVDSDGPIMVFELCFLRTRDLISMILCCDPNSLSKLYNGL